jgi:tetratricopeptide (TPR) repeat protein
LAADYPAVTAYAENLGGTYGNFGTLMRDRGEAAASLNWYAKALATLRPVLAKEPRLVMVRQFLRNAYRSRAEALAQLGKHADAAADWEQALALNDEKQYDGGYRLQWASALVRAGQHAAATVAAEELLQTGNAARTTLYDAACVYAVAVAQAAKQAPRHTSSLLAERYARRAVALLCQAVQRGFNNIAHLKKDPDLDSLRQRPDFHQLLAELEAKAPAK